MPSDGKVKIVLKLDSQTAALIMIWLKEYGASEHSSHGQLKTIEDVATMLLEDVALAVSRQGSWEGSNMWTVLNSHGYGNY